MPITWKNIGAPDLTGASRMLETGNRAIQQGVTGLQDILQKRTDLQAKNWEQGKTNNTNDVIARIMGAQSMDQYNALQPTLTADALKGQYGGQVDALKVMDAYNRRDNAIRSDQTESWAFEQQGRTEADRTNLGIAQSMVSEGKDPTDFIKQTQWEDAESASKVFNAFWDRTLEANTENRAQGTYQSNMASASQNRRNAAYAQDRRVMEDEQNDQNKQWNQMLANVAEQFTTNPNYTERDSIEGVRQYAAENNIPPSVVTKYLTGGGVSNTWDQYRNPTEDEVMLRDEALAQNERELVTNPQYVAAQSSISAAQNALKGLNPTINDSYKTSGDVLTDVLKLPIKENSWSWDDKVDADINNVTDQIPELYDSLMETFNKRNEESPVPLSPVLVGNALMQAVNAVNLHDVNGDGKGELDMEKVTTRAGRELEQLINTFNQQGKQQSIISDANRVIDGLSYQSSENKRGISRRFSDMARYGNKPLPR